MRRFIRDNGLTLALMAAFAFTFLAQFFTGWMVENQELTQHGQAALGALSYMVSGAFLSAVFENWESEFLQMASYVMLTAVLFQRGSSESRDPDDPRREQDDIHTRDPNAPWPLRAGHLAKRLYARSLGIALGLLFLLTFVLHWLNSWRAVRDNALMHGIAPPSSALAYLGDPQFWFESFQNWQSEFLSTAVLVVLTIFLRQQGSPESKPVAAPMAQTGEG